MRAAVYGLLAAVLIGALTNDSGPIILLIGSSYLLFAAVYLAQRPAGPHGLLRPRSIASKPPTAIDSIAPMRIALVSPYSWTFPGGVTRHIDALAREFLAAGHHVRVLSPVDPDDRLTRALHRRAPGPQPLPDYVVPLGRTVSLPMNGAMSRLAVTPESVVRLRARAARRGFDVIHVHEPIAPVVGLGRLQLRRGAPVVGTFHAYSAEWLPNTIARDVRRAPGVQPAARADRGLRGRAVDGRALLRRPLRRDPERRRPGAAPRGPEAEPSTRCGSCSSGREEERKGLPVLLSAFAGLRRHIPVRLDVIGAAPEAVEPLLAEVEGGMDGIEVHGRVDDASCGGGCTRPTCCARRRWAARASGWC